MKVCVAVIGLLWLWCEQVRGRELWLGHRYLWLGKLMMPLSLPPAGDSVCG